jgi:hypothetical protein
MWLAKANRLRRNKAYTRAISSRIEKGLTTKSSAPDATLDRPVLNRTIGLRDTFAKEVGKT